MDNVIVLSFFTLTIFSLMLAIGINSSLEQLTSLWRKPELLVRSLLAAIVLVPLVVFILLWLLDLPPGVAAGLSILAASPGAPVMAKRSQMAGGDPTYVASLQLTLAMLAVLVRRLRWRFSMLCSSSRSNGYRLSECSCKSARSRSCLRSQACSFSGLPQGLLLLSPDRCK